MKRLFFILTFLLCNLFLFPLSAEAATLRSDEHLMLSPTDHLTNVYAFGQDITSNAIITDDLVAAGSNITVHGGTTGSVMAAGGNIVVDGKIGNSVRAVGGNITISGPVKHDVVVAGGTVTIGKSASIGGDLIFVGGTLEVKGPVSGNIHMQGGNVIISSHVGGSVEGDMETVQLRDGAEIQGNLDYTSSQKALISDSAIVHGQEIYHVSRKENAKGIQKIFTTGVIFKLITDILFSLIIIYFFPGLIKRINSQARTKTLKSSLIGLGVLLFTPILAVLLLLIIWLGVTVGLVYLVFIIVSLFIGKILLGWYVLEWWNKRTKTKYVLDWKAAIVGPILFAILFLIPIIGWFVVAGIYIVSLGALVLTSSDLKKVTE